MTEEEIDQLQAQDEIHSAVLAEIGCIGRGYFEEEANQKQEEMNDAAISD